MINFPTISKNFFSNLLVINAAASISLRWFNVNQGIEFNKLVFTEKLGVKINAPKIDSS